MNANNFKLSANEETRSADSMLIYDKFVSLQATTPLGFNSGIRSRIEEKICSSDGMYIIFWYYFSYLIVTVLILNFEL